MKPASGFSLSPIVSSCGPANGVTASSRTSITAAAAGGVPSGVTPGVTGGTGVPGVGVAGVTGAGGTTGAAVMVNVPGTTVTV